MPIKLLSTSLFTVIMPAVPSCTIHQYTVMMLMMMTMAMTTETTMMVMSMLMLVLVLVLMAMNWPHSSRIIAVATNQNRLYCVIDPCTRHVAAWKACVGNYLRPHVCGKPVAAMACGCWLWKACSARISSLTAAAPK